MIKKLSTLILLIAILTLCVESKQFKGISMATRLDYFCVAQYKMNDNAATTTVVDSQGYSNGTFNDATGDPNTDTHSVAGKINTALGFDGTDDYVNTNSTFQSVFQDSFSINLWVKPDDGQPSSVQSFYGIDNCVDANFNIVGIDLLKTGKLRAGYAVGITVAEWNSHSVVFTDGQQIWMMVTFKIEKIDDNTIKGTLYANGVSLYYREYEIAMSSFGAVEAFYIGSINCDGVASFLFAGPIDDVMIFNKALSQMEITYLYNSGDGREL